MHVVECPGCQRKFKVPAPLRETRMRCSQCGQQFVASSMEVLDAPPPSAPSAPPVRGPAPIRAQRIAPTPGGHPTTRLFMMVATIVGIVGLLALGGGFCFARSRVKITFVDEYGRKVTRSVSNAEYNRIVKDREARQAEERSRRLGLSDRPSPPDERPAPYEPDEGNNVRTFPPDEPTTPPVTPPVPADPKLVAGRPRIIPAGIGSSSFLACGTLHNQHKRARRSVTVTAYDGNLAGQAMTYEYVPAGATIRYCVPAPGDKPDPATIRIVVTSGPEVPADTLVWMIDPTRIGEATLEDETFVWAGQTRNSTSTPAKNVKIHCDFFFADGTYAGTATGQVTDEGTVGAGRIGYFRLSSENSSLQSCAILVARAVGQKY